MAIIFHNSGEGDVKEILKSEQIFSDANKGLLASEESIKKVFGTDDVLKASEIIHKEGDIQLTSEYREQLREEKKKQIGCRENE